MYQISWSKTSKFRKSTNQLARSRRNWIRALKPCEQIVLIPVSSTLINNSSNLNNNRRIINIEEGAIREKILQRHKRSNSFWEASGKNRFNNAPSNDKCSTRKSKWGSYRIIIKQYSSKNSVSNSNKSYAALWLQNNRKR